MRPRPQVFHLSRDLSGGRMGLGPIMAAEEADVDIEGDVVPAAAQPGWGVETGSRRDGEERGCEESTLERLRARQETGEEDHPLGQGLLAAGEVPRPSRL